MYPSHSNQMNDVPVKISEKYKPPKKLTLSQTLTQRLAHTDGFTQQTLATAVYDFILERSVLNKIAEWQQMRQRELADRRERARIQQDERQKQLEQKQKQMLTAVSYPSAEELSSDDDISSDELPATTSARTPINVNQMNRKNAASMAGGKQVGHGAMTTARMGTMAAVTVTSPTMSETNPQVPPFSPPNYYDMKILEPTMAQQHKRNKSIGKSPNINYSDFEDGSSPFDNIELKTINDLDILAQVRQCTIFFLLKFDRHAIFTNIVFHIVDCQVLNKTANIQLNVDNRQIETATVGTPNNENHTTTSAITSNLSTDNNKFLGNNMNHQQNHIHLHQTITQNSQSIPYNCQSYYQQIPMTTEQANYYSYPSRDQQMSPDTTTMQMTDSNGWTVGAHPNSDGAEFGNRQVVGNVNGGWHNAYGQLPQGHQHQPYQQLTMNAIGVPNTQFQTTTIYDHHIPAGGLQTKIIYSATQQSAPPSKSKSVPDIMKELNDELQCSEGKRVRNNSQSGEKGAGSGGAKTGTVDGNANKKGEI